MLSPVSDTELRSKDSLNFGDLHPQDHTNGVPGQMQTLGLHHRLHTLTVKSRMSPSGGSTKGYMLVRMGAAAQPQTNVFVQQVGLDLTAGFLFATLATLTHSHQGW